MKDYIIVANGPFLVREIMEEAIQDKIIIALDGAADKLKRINIVPHIILGDFDSISPESQAYWGIQQTFHDITNHSLTYTGKHGVLIVPAKDQDNTDLVKAIRYCDQQHAASITLVCAAGGREDHYEGVKLALRTEYSSHRVITLHTEQQTLRCAKDETVLLEGRVGDHCGFIATNTGTCSSVGLEYECSEHAESICNVLRMSSATLAITGSALLIMPPQLASQRTFMQKNEEERLELQLRDVRSKPSPVNYLVNLGLFAVSAVGLVALLAANAQGHQTPDILKK